jgi:hypothetical protein
MAFFRGGGVEGAERSLIARIMGEKLCKIACNKVNLLDAETEIVNNNNLTHQGSEGMYLLCCHIILYQFSASWDLPGKDHFSHKQEIMGVTVCWDVLSHPKGGTI